MLLTVDVNHIVETSEESNPPKEGRTRTFKLRGVTLLVLDNLLRSPGEGQVVLQVFRNLVNELDRIGLANPPIPS